MSIAPTPSRVAAAGLISLAAAMGIGRFAFTPLLPLMQAEGLVSVAEGGVLASVHFAGYLLGALVAAWLHLPPRLTLHSTLLAIGVATLAMGLTESFALWLALRFACGVASAFTLVVVSNHFVRRLAEAGAAGLQGRVFSGVGAGIAIAGAATLAFMASGVTSPFAWQVFGWASLLAAVAVGLMGRAESGGAAGESALREGVRSRLDPAAVAAYGAAGVGYVIPATYLPLLARETIDAPMIFGLGWPVFGAAAFLSTLVSARLHARFSNRQVWAVSQLVMATGLLLPVAAPHILAVIASGLCVGGTFMIITMAGMKEAHRVARPHDVQRHIAVLTAAFAAGQMIAPVCAGWAFEAAHSFAPPLAVASMLLAATAVWLMRPSTAREAVRS